MISPLQTPWAAQPKTTPATAPRAPLLIPDGADSNMIRSGHSDFNTLYASNDVVTGRVVSG